jgi:hypothetical protein
MEDTKQADAPVEATSMLVRSRAAFLRDLPELLKNPKHDRWCVAYHGDERIGIAKSQMDLIRECKRRGIPVSDFFVGCIFPHGEEDEEVEFGVFEFDDIELDVNPDVPSESHDL